MRLRTINIDCPHLSGIVNSDLALRTRCTCSMVVRHFSTPVRIGSANLLLIEAGDRSDASLPVRNAAGTCFVPILAPHIDTLRHIDPRSCKEATADLIWQAIDKACRAGIVSSDGLLTVRDSLTTCRQKEFNNVYTAIKRRMSPDRKLHASLECDHDTDMCIGTIEITNRKGDVLYRHEAFRTKPDEIFFANWFGSITWLTPTKLLLEGKTRHNQSEVDLTDVIAS